MCGICGVVGIKSTEAGESTVRRMMDAMTHRGPDGDGILCAPPVALGMRRLSIIDLPGGGQPVFNERKNLAVVFNGEIYNFRELRKELEDAGHRFCTRSDTEVIVHAWDEWQERCIERLRGMFAFAIVEMPQGPGGSAARVFLARDRLGIKPLYYSPVDGNLFFASEVRALLASGCIPARLAAEALPSYLLFGAACEPLTLIDDVVSLPPGHLLTIECGATAQFSKPIAWWDLHRQTDIAVANDRAHSSSASLARRVRALLEQSVASHLVADVPVGIFLSSGLDSTAIAALASSTRGGIHTFTVAFTDAEFSEAELARRTASRLGTQHSELTLSDHEMVERLDEAVSALDQPSADGINTYFVSWAARQAGLKVALSGLGSDEIFGGYTSFRAASTFARASSIALAFPRQLRTFAASGLESSSAFGSSPDRLRKFASIFRDPTAFPDPYFFTRLLFTPQSFDSHLRARGSSLGETPPWWKWLAGSASETRSMDGFTRVSWLEMRSYLLNTLLRDTDAMSMRNSLEVRVPFLDSPLVEYVLSLPESLKRVPGRPKALLIDALADLLPPEIVAQRKRTFTFPWEGWLRGALGKHVGAGLADWSPALDAHISREFPTRVWRAFLDGRTSWSRPWSLYVLNEWVKRNVGEDQSSGSHYREPAAVA